MACIGTMCSMTTPQPSSVAQHENHIEHAIERIRGTLKSKTRTNTSTLEGLIMIDAVQRVGLDKYFKTDIHETLERQHHAYQEESYGDTDLHSTALRFRLLRQEGYLVSPDVFKKFQRNDGKFKEALGKDVKGLLSLYEACQLSIQGEELLDEATEFTTQLLRASLLEITNQPEALMIENTLKNPDHKSLATWVLSKNRLFLEFFHESLDDKDWIDNMVQLAEIDSEMAQISWRKEIVQVSKWGEKLNSTKMLGFARIQPIRWYMWSIGMIPHPNMMELRVDLTKVISLIYIIDDTFDIHGTIDELSLFTQVVNRWEQGDTEPLPDYMKVCVKTLFDFVDDFSLKIHRRHGWNPKHSLMKTWVDLFKACLKEAKWLASKELPSVKEYLETGTVSIGFHLVMVHAFFFLGENVNQITVDEINGFPPITSAIAIIARLCNDVRTYQYPNHAGNQDLSYMDCYINEDKECTTTIARQKVDRMIEDAWKCLNQEYFSSTSPFSANFKTICLNFARMASMMYNRDAKGRKTLEKLLNSLFHGTSS